MENDHCKCHQESGLASDEPTRRSVLGWMVTGINVAVLAALAVPGVRFILAPLGKRASNKWIDVLGEEELEIGQTREVSFMMNVRDGYQSMDRKYSVYLHRTEEGLKCFDPACTHLGCRIKFQDDQRRYFCPCHGGVFGEDGKVVSGPPPKGLVEHPVKVEQGRIYVSRQV